MYAEIPNLVHSIRGVFYLFRSPFFAKQGKSRFLVWRFIRMRKWPRKYCFWEWPFWTAKLHPITIISLSLQKRAFWINKNTCFDKFSKYLWISARERKMKILDRWEGQHSDQGGKWKLKNTVYNQVASHLSSSKTLLSKSCKYFWNL